MVAQGHMMQPSLGCFAPGNYGGHGEGEEQWIDGPSQAPLQAVQGDAGSRYSNGNLVDRTPPPAPVQQDVLYQWVDAPRQTQMQQAPMLSTPFNKDMSVPAYGAQQMPYQQQSMPMGGAYPQNRPSAGWGAIGQPPSPYDMGMQNDNKPFKDGGSDWWSNGRNPNAVDLHQPRPYKGSPMQMQQQQQQQQQHGYDNQARNQRRGSHGDNSAAYQLRTRGNERNDMGGRQGSRQSATEDSDAQLAHVLKAMGATTVRESLTATLESLYKDRIKPMASYVKGRLKERQTNESIVKSFVDVYAQHPDLFVIERPNKEDVTILLATEPEWFKGWVDMDSPNDPYDEVLWANFATFLDGEHAFAGGRYGTSRELMQRNLDFLASCTLGQVCHIIQLAIQNRKLLVYHRKMLKPIQTIMNQSTQGTGCTLDVDDEIKDMDQLCLLLLRSFVRSPQSIPLSRLKTLLKNEFGSTLVETSFKCTKLSELFSLEPLVDTFKINTEENGKAIFIDLGDTSMFSDHVKQIYSAAKTLELNEEKPSTM